MLLHRSPGQRREDLDHLANGLRREHRNLYHCVSREAFDAAVRTLDGRIPSLADHEAVVALARLVAMIGDGHTVLRLSEVRGFSRYPIVLERFGDGLFVRAISGELALAAGARLMAIEDVPADEAYAAVRSLVSRDNEMGVAAGVPALLAVPEVLHAIRVVARLEHATFTVQLRDGDVTTLTLNALPAHPQNLIDARDAAEAPTPLWLRRPTENWYERIPATDALYVGYNTVRDTEDRPLRRFFDEIFEVIAATGTDRLILDLRQNHGGNNALNLPLVHGLIRCDRVNRWGGLFALIGRRTFSAAMNLAVDLERHTRVLFVGEPTGASPNHYGENGAIDLPHSGLHVSVSTLWWQYSHPLDDRPWIAPDI
ncbi:MAG: hypothetical protein M3N47_05285, partial [Chloroflexota bacterium]|nr:hypothetical protein [Chloroflexota bacterium]